jgi:hypothetical protein
MNDFSKDMLVEQPTIELFSELEYEPANCFRGNWGPSTCCLTVCTSPGAFFGEF